MSRATWTRTLGFVLTLVILALTITDYPLGVLQAFWSAHQFFSSTVSGIIFLLVGLTLVADWTARREARRMYLIALVAYNAVARAPLAQRRVMWFATYGGTFIGDQDFVLSVDLIRRFKDTLARSNLAEYDESSARNGKCLPDPMENRLRILLKDSEWTSATYDLLRYVSYTYRVVLARWAPLLSSTERSGDVLIELANQVRQLAEIQYLLLPLVRNEDEPKPLADDQHEIFIDNWQHYFTNAVLLDEWLVRASGERGDRWVTDGRNLLDSDAKRRLSKHFAALGDHPMRLY